MKDYFDIARSRKKGNPRKDRGFFKRKQNKGGHNTKKEHYEPQDPRGGWEN